MATRNVNQQDTTTADDLNTEEEEADGSTMTLVEHLEELRWRILKSLIALFIGGIIAFIFRERIMQFLTLPLPKRQIQLPMGSWL